MTGDFEGMMYDSDRLVSVIIPCYNQGHFLAEAISSCLAQTYSHVEIVVVDDGSTDATREIAARFPVKYVYQENRGLSAARNTGIQRSEGEFLVFLDSDDHLLPHAVETALHFLGENNDCGMTVGNHRFITHSGEFIRESDKPLLHGDHYARLLLNNFIETPGCAMYRRSIVQLVGEFNTELRASEDYDFYLRVARSCKIVSHSEVVSDYRLHGSSMSRNPERMLTFTLQVLRGQEDYVRTHRHLRKPFRQGLNNWRRKYGRELALELAKSRFRSGDGSTGRKLALLQREYPAGLVIAFLGSLLPNRLLSIPEKRRISSETSGPIGLKRSETTS
jgi:glycosyltransferase involved in cell wall biosynthesis